MFFLEQNHAWLSQAMNAVFGIVFSWLFGSKVTLFIVSSCFLKCHHIAVEFSPLWLPPIHDLCIIYLQSTLGSESLQSSASGYRSRQSYFLSFFFSFSCFCLLASIVAFSCLRTVAFPLRRRVCMSRWNSESVPMLFLGESNVPLNKHVFSRTGPCSQINCHGFE